MTSEKPGDEDDLDLFGHPVQPIRDRRGRPSFAKTLENQDFVSVRAAAGWTRERIAGELGCDEKTLRKHFSRELEYGALIVDGMMLDVLMQKLRQGHVPSIRHLRERLAVVAPKSGRTRQSGADDGIADVPGQRPPEGKKELALQAAGEVPEDWGDIAERRHRH